MLRYSGLIWLLVAFVLPTTADAQFGFRNGGFDKRACKRQCHLQHKQFSRRSMPPVMPYCPQMMPQPIMLPPACPQMPVCPQVQTTYRQEQFTTYQPITRTHVRREAVQVSVPVTTHKQVTVDEGGYKMVWVPNLTTKTVAETTLQKQVQYRDVPYQVVENVPQVHTRIVPQTVAMTQPCCGPTIGTSQPVSMFTAMPVATVAQAPVAPPVSVPVAQPLPQQGEWVKVPQKAAVPAQAEVDSEIQLQNYERFAPAKSAKGMFSRPSSTSTALRTSRLY